MLTLWGGPRYVLRAESVTAAAEWAESLEMVSPRIRLMKGEGPLPLQDEHDNDRSVGEDVANLADVEDDH
eukprot:COSAG05_NODE_20_length_33177_cov_336.302639_16_plen_70_part_00